MRLADPCQSCILDMFLVEPDKLDIKGHYHGIFPSTEWLQITKSVLWVFFAIKRAVPCRNNPKDLDPSYKTDLDSWDCFGRKKPHLITVEIWYSIYHAPLGVKAWKGSKKWKALAVLLDFAIVTLWGDLWHHLTFGMMFSYLWDYC